MTGPDSLDGKNIIVTGAAGDAGRAMAEALAAAGAHVVAVDSAQETLREIADGIAGRVLPMAADLGDTGQCARLVTRAHLSFGALQGLVNNHATGHSAIRGDYTAGGLKFWALADEDWRALYEGDARAAFLLAREAVRYFLDQGDGRIVNVAAGPDAPAFAALTASWSQDMAGTGTTVNMLLPGDVPPDRIAAPVRWLLSDASAGFTGNCLTAAAWDPSLPDGEAAANAARPAARIFPPPH